MNDAKKLAGPSSRAGEKNAALTRKIEYGTFNSRMFAAVIDIFFIMIIALPITDWVIGHMYNPIDMNGLAILGSVPQTNEEIIKALVQWLKDQQIIQRILATNLLQLAFIGAYILPFWLRYSSTPGKMFLKLEIVDATSLNHLTRGQAVARYLGYVLSGIVLTLGFVWMLFNKRRQCWHDKIAHTIVIIREKPAKVKTEEPSA